MESGTLAGILQGPCQENVEFVRNLYAVHNRGDGEFWDLYPPDFVWDFSQQIDGPGVLRRDQARAEYDRLRHLIFEDGYLRLEPKELIDGGDKVPTSTSPDDFEQPLVLTNARRLEGAT
jgi:ketosteroid isomerase-like protein